MLLQFGQFILPFYNIDHSAFSNAPINTKVNTKGEDLLNLASIVKAKVILEYESKTFRLNLVATTDGARTIRHRLQNIFGVAVTIILDWYQLCF